LVALQSGMAAGLIIPKAVPASRRSSTKKHVPALLYTDTYSVSLPTTTWLTTPRPELGVAPSTEGDARLGVFQLGGGDPGVAPVLDAPGGLHLEHGRLLGGHIIGPALHPEERGHGDGDQDGDDEDHHHQLDQGEPGLLGRRWPRHTGGIGRSATS
jgi:hypothetical protein